MYTNMSVLSNPLLHFSAPQLRCTMNKMYLYIYLEMGSYCICSSLDLCVCVCMCVCVCVCVWERERERERTQNSECFIVEGHLSHCKWYDYKHAHTTYRKQLTNNTKQTDKTKRPKRKRETKKRNKHEQKENKTKTTRTKTRTPLPPPPKKKKKKRKATMYSRCRRHTSDTYKSKHCRIWYSSAY